MDIIKWFDGFIVSKAWDEETRKNLGVVANHLMLLRMDHEKWLEERKKLCASRVRHSG